MMNLDLEGACRSEAPPSLLNLMAPLVLGSPEFNAEFHKKYAELVSGGMAANAAAADALKHAAAFDPDLDSSGPALMEVDGGAKKIKVSGEGLGAAVRLSCRAWCSKAPALPQPVYCAVSLRRRGPMK
jgi:hypothetical protein